MPPVPQQAQDLVGYLQAKFEDAVEGGKVPAPLDGRFTLAEIVAHFRETMRTLNPQSMSYAGNGMSLRLATGHELLLAPPIDLDRSADSIGAFSGGVSLSNKGSSGGGSSVQHGDYPLTGAKEPRHERMTRKPD